MSKGQPVFTSSAELTITKAKQEPRFNFATNSVTSAGGTIYLSADPGEFLSLGVYKNLAPMSVAISNDIIVDGDLTAANYREDPDHDITSTLDYLKTDSRGITAAKIVRAADTVNVVAQIRAIGYKNAK